MKDYVLELASKAKDNSTKLNIIREYLQALILRIIQEKGKSKNIAFLGGTALRMLYGLPRFSEDLDFSLVNNKNYEFTKLLSEIKANLITSGFEISITLKNEKAVQSAFIKFSSLLYETEISPMKSQNLSIKIDVDTNPPLGAITQIMPLLIHFPIEVMTYDPSSLFSGKCHAILCRNYTKGRDFFDLAWYLTNWKTLIPNFELLKNSLRQTNSELIPDNPNSWVELLIQKVNETDWDNVEKDVRIFLERANDLQVFSKNNITNLLKIRNSNA